jgi:hypothetical protein
MSELVARLPRWCARRCSFGRVRRQRSPRTTGGRLLCLASAQSYGSPVEVVSLLAAPTRGVALWGNVDLSVARGWRAVGAASHRRGLPARMKWSFALACRVDARGLSEHGCLVVNPRAVGGRSDQRGAHGVQIRMYAACGVPGSQPLANYAINATPEQALRSNRALRPARVIAALEVI